MNQKTKKKNKRKKKKHKTKILKLFGTSLRYYKHISGSITHLSNKLKKCQEPLAKKKKAQMNCAVEIITALHIIPLET